MNAVARNAMPEPASPSALIRFLDHPRVQHFIIGLIVVNALILGMETIPSAAPYLPTLHLIDHAMLWVFVAELVARLIAFRLSFFKDPWNVFDFLVIGIALAPATGALSVLRALRVLRVLRLISMVPTMKRVVTALLAAVPGMGSIVVLLLLVQYVAAVMATKLFAVVAPEMFGSLGKSWFTLFQIMTVEGWPDIARGVMAEMPYAWIFFVAYLLLSTFTVMNLFVGVVVSAMQDTLGAENAAAEAAEARAEQAHKEEVLAQLRALRSELEGLRAGR